MAITPCDLSVADQAPAVAGQGLAALEPREVPADRMAASGMTADRTAVAEMPSATGMPSATEMPSAAEAGGGAVPPEPELVAAVQGREVSLPRLAGIGRAVDAVLASWHCAETVFQNRRYHRMPYRQPLLLVAIDPHSGATVEGPWVARGRDLSQGGLSYFHRNPQPFRQVAVQFVDQLEAPAALLLRVGWCRFTREGHYQSGGQFVRAIPAFAGPEIDWRELPQA